MVSLTSQTFLRCTLVSSIAPCSLAKTHLEFILHCHLADKLTNEQQVYSAPLLSFPFCLLADLQARADNFSIIIKLCFQLLDQLFAKVTPLPMLSPIVKTKLDQL